MLDLHPFFVHFVVAGPLLALALGVPAIVTGRWRGLKVTAQLMVVTAVISIAATYTGEEAHETVDHERVPGIAMENHEDAGEWTRNVAIATGLLGLLLLWRRRWDARSGSILVLASTITAGYALYTGFLGGELVFRHGANVQAPPVDKSILRSSGSDHSGHEGHEGHEDHSGHSGHGEREVAEPNVAPAAKHNGHSVEPEKLGRKAKPAHVIPVMPHSTSATTTRIVEQPVKPSQPSEVPDEPTDEPSGHEHHHH